jgi:MarR family transcriptional regulator, organic hydroperoxide resistance regulator
MDKRISKYCGCLQFTANALARVMNNIGDEEFGKIGLTASHAFVLKEAVEKPGIQPKELSEELHLTPSTITRLIEKLEHKGYLRRTSEGKSTLVYATDEGQRMSGEVSAAWQRVHLRYETVMGEDQSHELANVVYRAVRALEVE